jgi:hypothetical protein
MYEILFLRWNPCSVVTCGEVFQFRLQFALSTGGPECSALAYAMPLAVRRLWERTGSLVDVLPDVISSSAFWIASCTLRLAACAFLLAACALWKVARCRMLFKLVSQQPKRREFVTVVVTWLRCLVYNKHGHLLYNTLRAVRSALAVSSLPTREEKNLRYDCHFVLRRAFA